MRAAIRDSAEALERDEQEGLKALGPKVEAAEADLSRVLTEHTAVREALSALSSATPPSTSKWRYPAFQELADSIRGVLDGIKEREGCHRAAVASARAALLGFADSITGRRNALAKAEADLEAVRQRKLDDIIETLGQAGLKVSPAVAS